MKANGNFSDASLERLYSVRINRVMSLRNDHKTISLACVTPL